MIIMAVAMVWPCCALAQTEGEESAIAAVEEHAEEDTVNCVRFSGEVATEVNYGKISDAPHLWDFPHITVAGMLELPRGWSFVAELEYERFREDGDWGNNFRDNYTTNLLYVNKHWSDAVNVKAGIIDVPVSVTNSRGSALTIYDPVSEAEMLPMTWHEGGVALWGALGRWHYEVGGLMYSAFTARSTRAIGIDARSEYWFVDRDDDYAKVAVSGYWGTSGWGNLGLQRAAFMEEDGVLIGAIDWDVCLSGLVTDGSFIKSTDANVWSVGAEVGYNVLQRCTDKAAVVPFVRYDGFFDDTMGNYFTLGMNVSLPYGFILKGQNAWYHKHAEKSSHHWDLSLGYVLSF